MKERVERHELDPARLASGRWNPEREKEEGEGDVMAAYSADRIGMGQPLRRPFRFNGSWWTVTSLGASGGGDGGHGLAAEAYRLVAVDRFDGPATTYAEKTKDDEAARADPNGFYHGTKVRCSGRDVVIVGPPALFVPGRPRQAELFPVPPLTR